MYDWKTGNAIFMEAADHECDDPQFLEWQFFDEMVPVLERAQNLIQRVSNNALIYF